MKRKNYGKIDNENYPYILGSMGSDEKNEDRKRALYEGSKALYHINNVMSVLDRIKDFYLKRYNKSIEENGPEHMSTILFKEQCRILELVMDYIDTGELDMEKWGLR